MNTIDTRREQSRIAVFTRNESNVRSYCRNFPRVFARAKGSYIYDHAGRGYLDFLAGAGTLNYGHNHPAMQQALVDYIQADGIAHGLDLHTAAKASFITTFERLVLQPRNLDYVIQFPGPTGTNAVEAALKIARRVTGRTQVIAFTNAFHGVTAGALAATGNRHHRGASGVELSGVMRMPFDGYLGPDVDTLDYLEKALGDPSSGIDMPAAVIFETVQGEGGLNVASDRWLQRLAAVCKRHDILTICDDIQAGCGRMGAFFSFERAGVHPDIVTLSKSLSGLGLPLAVTLIRRELDAWMPGEHNGTFRGNNHAFVTAEAALQRFWAGPDFAREVTAKGERLRAGLQAICANVGDQAFTVRGRGMMLGIACPDGDVAAAISKAAFSRGMIIETAGPFDEVLKCLCPLTIDDRELDAGLSILETSLGEVWLRGPMGAARRSTGDRR